MPPRRTRGPRIVPQRQGMEYLFRKPATTFELTMHLEEKVKQDLKHIDPEILRLPTDNAAQKLVEHYTLHVPALDRDHITESAPEQIQMEVPAHTQNRVFFEPGPHYVPATAITIRVPFTGDPELFKYPPNSFGGNHIEAQLDGDAIVMTHRSEHPDPAKIQQDFDARMAQIETNLQFVKGHTDQFNDKLPHLIRNEVTKQQAIQQRDANFTLGYNKTPAPEPPAIVRPVAPPVTTAKLDIFLSHASEDKDSIARPLFEALRTAGVTVWFDEASLKIGDSLRRKIDEGLAKCNYGVVIISPSFLSKEWPQRELDGLAAREVANGKTIILPIWHTIDFTAIAEKSPTLADRVAAKSTEGIDVLVQKILAVIRQ